MILRITSVIASPIRGSPIVAPRATTVALATTSRPRPPHLTSAQALCDQRPAVPSVEEEGDRQAAYVAAQDRRGGGGSDRDGRFQPELVRDHVVLRLGGLRGKRPCRYEQEHGRNTARLADEARLQARARGQCEDDFRRSVAQDIELQINRIAPAASTLDARLQRGDVLIFGNFHTGIVRSSDGSFDHFLQIPGKTGTTYTPEQAARLENYFVGPGRSWTLQQFFAFSRDQTPEVQNENYSWAAWKEWLGRRLFAAPKQYPFLHATAVVWRRVTLPPSGTTFAGRWSTFAGTGELDLEAVGAAKGAKAVAFYSAGSASAACGSGSGYYTGAYHVGSDSGQVAACTDSSGRKLTGWYKSGSGPQNGSFTISLSADGSDFSGSYEERSGEGSSGPYDGTRTG